MKHRLAILPVAVAVVAAIAATPAAAQVVGTYTGTSANGAGVSFTVTNDVATGKLEVTGANIGFSATCSNGFILNTGWGYAPNQDIMGNTVSNTSFGSYFTISFTLTFSADNQTATGTISSTSPTLYKVGKNPRRALFCVSASQPMGVTLQTSAARINPPANTAAVIGKVQSVQP